MLLLLLWLSGYARKSPHQKFVLNGGRDELAVTVSVGIASTETGPEDDNAQKLIKRTDEALYKAKSDGRNRVIKSAA